MQEHVLARRAQRDGLGARRLAPSEDHLLAQDHHGGRVRRQRQHDQIRVQAVDAVTARPLARRTDVLRDLMLALARAVGARENDPEATPERIVLDLVPNEVPQLRGHLAHKGRARRDAIRVELGISLLRRRLGRVRQRRVSQRRLGGALRRS